MASLVAAATSDRVLVPDLPQFGVITSAANGSQKEAKGIVKAIRERLAHPDRQVKMNTLALLTHIARHADPPVISVINVDPLMHQLSDLADDGAPEVRTRVLSFVRDWGSAWDADSPCGRLYNSLVSRGIRFPAPKQPKGPPPAHAAAPAAASGATPGGDPAAAPVGPTGGKCTADYVGKIRSDLSVVLNMLKISQTFLYTAAADPPSAASNVALSDLMRLLEEVRRRFSELIVEVVTMHAALLDVAIQLNEHVHATIDWHRCLLAGDEVPGVPELDVDFLQSKIDALAEDPQAGLDIHPSAPGGGVSAAADGGDDFDPRGGRSASTGLDNVDLDLTGGDGGSGGSGGAVMDLLAFDPAPAAAASADDDDFDPRS